MRMGASQTAIAEHAKPTLSDEQQSVLTQALVNINSTTVHGVTISTGKFALVLFYVMNSCVHYEVFEFGVLHLAVMCLHLIVFARRMH